jgi:hypothetical protein
MDCACTSPPVWLGTTELAYFQVNLTPGSGQHPSRWLWQAGWRAAGPPISLSCAGPSRRAKSESLSIQQQPESFHVAYFFSIGQECAATSAPPRLALQQTSESASQRSRLMLWPATSWREWGVLLVLLLMYVTNLQVKELSYTVTIDSLTTTQAGQWIRWHASMHMVMDSNPILSIFWLFDFHGEIVHSRHLRVICMVWTSMYTNIHVHTYLFLLKQCIQ